ncbi:MAG: phage holin family protein [Cellulosilyticaceae bacterium]
MKENILDFKIALVGVIAIINMYLTGVFGVFTPLAYLVCGLMVADLITRAYAAGRRDDEKVQSKKVIEGIYKKLGMIMLIVLSLLLDYGATQLANGLGITITSKVIFTALTLAWIFVREFISNLENLQHAGIELPPFITKALNIAKDKVDQMGDTIVGGDKK